MFDLKPFICNYFITLRCESSCQFCDIWQNWDNQKIKESSTQEVANNLAALKNFGVKAVNFTGGEPFLREDLPEILKVAKQKGLRTLVTTNGVFYPDYAEELQGLIDDLYFSLDAPWAAEHNHIRGDQSFADVIESIHLAKEQKQKFALNFTVTRESIEFLPDMVELAQKYKVPLRLTPVFGPMSGFNPRSIDYVKHYFRRKLVYIDLASWEFLAKGGNKKRSPRCRAVDAVVTISPDGYLLFPCFSHWQTKVKIEGDLKEIYAREEIKKVKREEGRFDFCERCMVWWYLQPSFWYRPDKYFFLHLYSQAVNWLKNKSIDDLMVFGRRKN